jgi:hypothetical protein
MAIFIIVSLFITGTLRSGLIRDAEISCLIVAIILLLLTTGVLAQVSCLAFSHRHHV